MSLKDWQENGWLKPHKTDIQEISGLMDIVKRDLSDATTQGLSLDWKFGITYNAALKLCCIILYTQGYRPENNLAHYRTIMALKEIPGQNWTNYAAYLNSCRMQRNVLEYNQTNVISNEDMEKLLSFTVSFHNEVQKYLILNFPEYIIPEPSINE
ncbi:MAG: hypothetical protein IJS08_07870 [Victivallales bacterium]|nr:hypothetical protein [Victivallales bacterium]